MSDNILFDNIIITDDKMVSEQWAAETFDLKRNLVDRDQVSNRVLNILFEVVSMYVQRKLFGPSRVFKERLNNFAH